MIFGKIWSIKYVMSEFKKNSTYSSDFDPIKYEFSEQQLKCRNTGSKLINLTRVDGLKEATAKFYLKTHSNSFKNSSVNRISEIQAEAILELKLRHLAKLEEIKIKTEADELNKERKSIELLLSSEARLKTFIKKELRVILEEFGDQRRCQIVSDVETAQAFNDEDMIIRNAMEEWSNNINSHLGNLRSFGSASPALYKANATVTHCFMFLAITVILFAGCLMPVVFTFHCPIMPLSLLRPSSFSRKMEDFAWLLTTDVLIAGWFLR